MISNREVIRRFTDIKNKYQDKEPAGVNCYRCKCGHITKTIDIDYGVTPFMFECDACGQYAHSSFYTDLTPDKQPTWEWYRPTLAQVLKMRKKPGLLEHILKGGLKCRSVKKDVSQQSW